MKTFLVVTGILMSRDKILILKKSHDDFNYPDKWSFCSGFVKEFEPAEQTAVREIKEETGLDAEIAKTGGIVEVVDGEKRWIVATFLCKTGKREVKLCHENSDFRWVSKEELKDYDFVPGLEKEYSMFFADKTDK